MDDFLANYKWIRSLYHCFFLLDHDNLEKDAVHKKRSSNHKSHYDSLSDRRLL